MNEENKNQDAFVSQSIKFLRRIIGPVMERIGKEIKAGGNNFEIENKEYVDPAQRYMPKKIMKVQPSGTRKAVLLPEDMPKIIFSPNSFLEMFEIFISNVKAGITPIQPIKRYKLDELSEDIVEKEIRGFLEEVFKYTWS